MADKIFRFKVKSYLEYRIKADDEHTARKILTEDGGFDIGGKMYFDDDSYENAELIGEE